MDKIFLKNELYSYQLLGLKPGASIDEVKRAYRDMIKVWHPDRFCHDQRLQLKAQECSVSKPSGIKEINPVRDFLLNLKQKRKSNESTFKSRETYKRNTT